MRCRSKAPGIGDASKGDVAIQCLSIIQALQKLSAFVCPLDFISLPLRYVCSYLLAASLLIAGLPPA